MKSIAVLILLTLLTCTTEARRTKRRSKQKNCYDKLGISTDANERQIKKAFRKLALKYHPDKVKEEKDKEKSEAKFKDLAHCYEILADEEQRKMYDASGYNEDYAQSGQGGGFQFRSDGMDFGDLFSSFFGGNGASGSSRGSNGGFTFNFGGPSGGGGSPFGFGDGQDFGMGGQRGHSGQRAQNMNGHHQQQQQQAPSRKKAKLAKAQKVYVDLESLMDDSFHVVRLKKTSRGKGSGGSDRSVELEVPRGCPDGHVIEEQGQRFSIHTNPHRDYARGLLSHKSDLYTNVTITLEQALLGFTLELMTIDGQLIEEEIENVPHSMEYQVKRKGLPRFDSKATTRGHLYVHFDVKLPTLSEEEKTEMRARRETEGSWDYSEATKYRQKMEQRRRKRAKRRSRNKEEL